MFTASIITTLLQEEKQLRVKEPELALDFLREQVGRGNYVYTAPCGEEPVR